MGAISHKMSKTATLIIPTSLFNEHIRCLDGIQKKTQLRGKKQVNIIRREIECARLTFMAYISNKMGSMGTWGLIKKAAVNIIIRSPQITSD